MPAPKLWSLTHPSDRTSRVQVFTCLHTHILFPLCPSLYYRSFPRKADPRDTLQLTGPLWSSSYSLPHIVSFLNVLIFKCFFKGAILKEYYQLAQMFHAYDKYQDSALILLKFQRKCYHIRRKVKESEELENIISSNSASSSQIILYLNFLTYK